MDLAGLDLDRDFLGRADYPESIDTLVLHDLHQLSPVAEHPELSPPNSQQPSAQNGVHDLSIFGGPQSFEKTGIPSHPGSTRPPTPGSHRTAFVSPISDTWPSAPSAVSPFSNGPPSPRGWTTNAPAFANGSHPNIRFVPDRLTSEPARDKGKGKGKGVDRRHHTEPVAGKECGCAECDAQSKGLLSSEMVYAYLAMRGAQSGEGDFAELVGKYREGGRGVAFPSCPHALSKMKKEVEKAAKRAGSRPLANAPSFVRDDAGPSGDAPSTVLTFGTDFNEDDVSDGGDVTKGTISPGTFLRMASGISRAETEKPLPPLPSSSALTPRQQLEKENEDGWKDRVDGPGFRAQVCEETMDALTGSYTVSSNPSMIHEPPGVRHLNRLRGAFGNLFTRMQPSLGERLDRVRLGLPNESDNSLSVFSEGEYTTTELEAALASPSATAINGIPPPRVAATLTEAERATTHLEDLETTAHARATTTSDRLTALRAVLARVASAATYIAERRSSSRRAKIRRSVGARLRGLEYRRARALDALRGEKARHGRDVEDIREVEATIARVVGTVGMRNAEEVLLEASRLWDEAHGQGSE